MDFHENESLLRPGQKKPKKESKTRRYTALIVVGILTGAYSISEIVISRYLDSVALLSDGVHNLSDVISLIIAFAALMKSTSKKKDEFTYGWKRTEILGAVLNGAFLMSLALYIVIEAIPKFFTNDSCDDLSKLTSNWVYVTTASAGLAINTLGTILFCLLSGGHGHVHAGGGDHHHGHSHGDKKDKKHGHSHHGHGHEEDIRKDNNKRKLSIPILFEHDEHEDEEKLRKNSKRKMSKPIALDDVLEHKSLQEDNDHDEHDHHKHKDHKHKDHDHDHKHKDKHHDHKHKDHDHDHKHKDKDPKHKHKEHDHEHDHDHKHKEHDHKHRDKDHDHDHKHKEHDHDHDHDHKHKDHDHDHDHHKHEDHDDGKDMNIHAVFLHYLGDALSSLLLVATGLLVKFFPDQTWTRYLDPIASILIVILILWTTIPLLKRCSTILLQQTPSSIQIPKLHKKLCKIEGVQSVHDLHVWQLVDSMVIASLHIRLSDYDSKKFQIVSTKVKQVLHDFGVHSITIQPEFSVSPNQSKTCDQNCIAECEEDWCCIDDQPIVQTT